ncbi:putative reverse transcriptase domain-containing protein [Tanacetum coccineum]
MPLKQMSQVAIAKLIADEVKKALDADRATRNTSSAGGAGNVGGAGGPKRAQPTRDCTFSSFIKCGPTQFHGKEGVIELCPQVATLGLAEANGKSLDDMKKMMLEELCPEEEISRMEDELRNLSKCGKRGHHVRDCRGKGVATGANAEPIRVCFKCGDPNHLANSELCPEKKKQDGRNASGHVYE